MGSWDRMCVCVSMFAYVSGLSVCACLCMHVQMQVQCERANVCADAFSMCLWLSANGSMNGCATGCKCDSFFFFFLQYCSH